MFFFYVSFDWLDFYTDNLFLEPFPHFPFSSRNTSLELFLVFCFNLVTDFANKKQFIQSTWKQWQNFIKGQKSHIWCPLWPFLPITRQTIISLGNPLTSLTSLDSYYNTKLYVNKGQIFRKTSYKTNVTHW